MRGFKHLKHAQKTTEQKRRRKSLKQCIDRHQHIDKNASEDNRITIVKWQERENRFREPVRIKPVSRSADRVDRNVDFFQVICSNQLSTSIRLLGRCEDRCGGAAARRPRALVREQLVAASRGLESSRGALVLVLTRRGMRGGGRGKEADEDRGHVVAPDARLRAVRRQTPHQELLADLRKQ